MTTFNTGNPIGSTDARDRLDNSENLDLAVNSLSQTFVDRLGVTRDTLEGIYQKSAYYRAGTFDAGYTLTNNRQTLAYGNIEYSWSGPFPKVVAPASTPETTGGVGAGAWVDRTDATLRSEINIVQRRFSCVADMIADTTLLAGDIVETIGYHNGWVGTADSPKGGNRYEVVAAGTGVDDGGSFITLGNGLQAKALFSDGIYSFERWGAKRDGVTYDTTAMQNAINYCSANSHEITAYGGTYKFTKVTIPTTGLVAHGAGRGQTIFESDTSGTAITHTVKTKFYGFTLKQTSSYQGIGFGTPQDDSSSSQAAYCIFYDFDVTGFNYSFWWRASIWSTFTNGHSKSKIGIRLARYSDPYDLGANNAHAAWNSYSPMGFFHNQGTVDNVNFEDVEAGVWGCPVGFNFSNITTQGQTQSASLNTILPTTVEPCGLFLHGGIDGTKLFGNTITDHYAEGCRIPVRVKDQRSITINGQFLQGAGTTGTAYPCGLYADNSTVYVEGSNGQDYFTYNTVMVNGSVVYGLVGGSYVSAVASYDSTSEYNKRREYSNYIKHYKFTKSAGATATVTLPGTLDLYGHYQLRLAGLNDGSTVNFAVYDIFKWNSTALTNVNLASGAATNFTVTIVNSAIVITLTNTTSFAGYAILDRLSEFKPDTITLTPV